MHVLAVESGWLTILSCRGSVLLHCGFIFGFITMILAITFNFYARKYPISNAVSGIQRSLVISNACFVSRKLPIIDSSNTLLNLVNSHSGIPDQPSLDWILAIEAYHHPN